jgi:hypothetical protein
VEYHSRIGGCHSRSGLRHSRSGLYWEESWQVYDALRDQRGAYSALQDQLELTASSRKPIVPRAHPAFRLRRHGALSS